MAAEKENISDIDVTTPEGRKKKMLFLTGKAAEVLADRIQNELPVSGSFQKMSVTCALAGTENRIIFFVQKAYDAPEQRYLFAGVYRNGSSRVRYYSLKKGTNEELIERLNTLNLEETYLQLLEMSDKVDEEERE